MADPDKVALLNAIAQGQSPQLIAAQRTAQAQPIGAALAQAVATQNLPQGAASQLNTIEHLPVEIGRPYTDMQLGAQQSYRDSIQAAYKQFNDTLFNKVVPMQLAKQALEGASGGGGGGGGGSSGGGGGGRGGSKKSAAGKDWLDQARQDAGLVGSGIRSKTGLPPYLRQASLEGVPKGSPTDRLPRDLREQQYLQEHYGAPANEVDKAAPISGFLKQALDGLNEARQRGIDQQTYIKKLHEEARKLKGDQSRAVEYARLLAMQQLSGRGGVGAAAGRVVSGATGGVGAAVNKAIGGLF